MVGIISSGSRPTTVDGFLDVSTSVTFPIWGSILDTSLQTMKSDQLYSYPCHKTIRGKAVYPNRCRISLVGTRVWPTKTSLVAQSDDANLEGSTQNEIGLDSRRVYSRVYCLEKAEDRGCSPSSSQNASLNSRSCSHTTIESRDCQIRVCFREIGNGAKVLKALGSGR